MPKREKNNRRAQSLPTQAQRLFPLQPSDDCKSILQCDHQTVKYNFESLVIFLNDIVTFTSSQFGNVRTIQIKGITWFVGKDVASALKYQNASKAIADHVDAEDKLNNESLLSLGQRGGWLINESGLYSLVLSSKLPNAKQFKRWITGEVLPSIRKHGGYIAGQESMSDTELIAKALIVANRVIDEKQARINSLENKIQLDAPKVLFAEAVQASRGDMLIRELARLLSQNGVDIGQNRLFAWLRNNGYLIRSGSSYNLPTQYSMNLGLFRVVEQVVYLPAGGKEVRYTPYVTPKGRMYFLDRFLNKGGKLAALRT